MLLFLRGYWGYVHPTETVGIVSRSEVRPFRVQFEKVPKDGFCLERGDIVLEIRLG